MLFVAFGAQAQGVVNKVVAKVGGELILLSDIQEQLAYIEDKQGSVSPEDRCYILESLLAQKLLVNQAKLDSVVVMDEEVDAQIDGRIEQILAMMNNDISQFEGYYGKTVEQVRSQMFREMKSQLLAERMRSQVMSKAEATPSEVVSYYKSIPSDSLPYYNSEVELQELVTRPEVNKVEREKAIEKLEDLRKKIVEDSASFTSLARTYSDDPGSARNGGDLGMMKRGSLVPEFEATAYNLRPNEVSEIVETEYGFHIIKLLERRGNNIHTQHILIKPEITEQDLEFAKMKLDSIRNLIVFDSLSFEAAVRIHGYDKVQSYNNGGRMINPATGDNFFEVGDLDPEIYFSTDTLEVGEITQPLEFSAPGRETLFRIIKLNSRTDPHKASLKKDYAKIQMMATEQKKGSMLIDWLDNVLKNTYIEISPEFHDCPNMDKWLKTDTARK